MLLFQYVLGRHHILIYELQRGGQRLEPIEDLRDSILLLNTVSRKLLELTKTKIAYHTDPDQLP